MIIEQDGLYNTNVTYTRGVGYGGGIGEIISVIRREEDEEELELFYYHYNGIGTVTALTD